MEIKIKFSKIVQLTKWLVGAITKGVKMSKELLVAAFVSDVQSGVVQVYTDKGSALYDGAFSEGVASVPMGTGGGFQQSDIDNAVKAQVDADALVLADAQKQGADALATLQGQFDSLKGQDDALVIKEGTEAQTLQNLQASKDALAAVLASLNAIGQPAPIPTPVPSPDPVPAA